MAKSIKQIKADKRKKGLNPKAYTLETPIVADYIKFVAAREKGLLHKIFPENCQTEAEFCIAHGLSENSLTTLHNYAKINDFWKEADKYGRSINHLLLSIGMRGLTKLSEGMFVTRQALDKDGCKHDLKFELEPHEKACERLAIMGGALIEDKIVITNSIAGAFAAAAAAEEEKK